MSTPEVTAILPTHNPHPARLRRTLAALRAQTLPAAGWETILVDNGSRPPFRPEDFADVSPPGLRVVPEPEVGLSAARARGFREARAPFCVLVDDDNVLDPAYLSQVARIFRQYPGVGACGGRSLPEFESEPAPWTREFLPLLALRDLGEAAQFGGRRLVAGHYDYPACAPIGAGMAVRTEAARDWLAAGSARQMTDRRGGSLASGGDNDIVLTLLEHGWQVAYFPELSLTHLIPGARLEAGYLARLNRAIQRSWMQVLAAHGASPWPALARRTVPLRQFRAFFTHRAWQSKAAHIRWRGACGHFEGRAA